jgi:hypothetical protein
MGKKRQNIGRHNNSAKRVHKVRCGRSHFVRERVEAERAEKREAASQSAAKTAGWVVQSASYATPTFYAVPPMLNPSGLLLLPTAEFNRRFNFIQTEELDERTTTLVAEALSDYLPEKRYCDGTENIKKAISTGISMGIPIVTASWMEKCASDGHLVDKGPFYVQGWRDYRGVITEFDQHHTI